MWKGKYSEKLVFNKLQELSDEYVILNDILFENNGHSTQIDHIVISPYGVFIIETKGYKGWILGGENSEYWIQTIYKNKYRFYNPIKQNDGHIRFLRHILRCSIDIPFIPIVVFNNAANLKVQVEHHIVVNRCDLIWVMLQYKTKVLSQATINWIVKTIQQHSVITDKENLEWHNHNVKYQRHRNKQNITNGVCPRCGNQLVLRQGKYGEFYGCSNFPRCKFTIKP